MEAQAAVKDVHFQISGMSCDNCVRHVQAALSDLSGVTVRDVKVGSATVRVEPDQGGEKAVILALQEAGYGASVSS